MPSVQWVPACVTSLSLPRLPELIRSCFAAMAGVARAGEVVPIPGVAPVSDRNLVVNLGRGRDPASGAILAQGRGPELGGPQALPPGCRVWPHVHGRTPRG